MITWRLWSALRNPPSSDPLFQRIATLEYHFNIEFPKHRLSGKLALLLILPLIGVMLAIYPQTALFLFLLMPMSIALLVFAVPVFLLFGTSIVGMFWAVVVCNALVREREARRYDLLCMTPDGEVGATWSICAACLHRGSFFELMDAGLRALMLVFSVMLTLLTLLAIGIGLNNSRTPDHDLMVSLRTLVEAITLVLVYFLHHQQSVVLSGLVGAVSAIYLRSRLEAQLIVPVLFLGLQIGSYFLGLLVAVDGMSQLYSRLFIPDSLAVLTLPLAMMATFFLLREAIIFGCWALLRQHLQAHTSEYDFVLRAAR